MSNILTNLDPITPAASKKTNTSDPPSQASNHAKSFHRCLQESSPSTQGSNGAPVQHPGFTLLPADIPLDSIPDSMYTTPFPDAYQTREPRKDQMSGWEKYKDDQLLSNPGGDHYNLRDKSVDANPKEQEGFWGRIKKDLSDSFDNLKNSVGSLLFGTKMLYRDDRNQIQETHQKGLLGSVGDFFEDLGSALSFGAWRPDKEAEPQGFLKRMGFFYSKMKEALFGDLVQGVGGSAIRSGEGLVLSGWNLLEVVPDATIGNLEEGRKLTTTIFDNGQVAIDYLTDILPTGEAWLRVHSPNFDDLNDAKAPVVYNIQLPERYKGDARWEYVRNTPFRKTIETIGSIVADIATVAVLGDSSFSSEGRKD